MDGDSIQDAHLLLFLRQAGNWKENRVETDIIFSVRLIDRRVGPETITINPVGTSTPPTLNFPQFLRIFLSTVHHCWGEEYVPVSQEDPVSKNKKSAKSNALTLIFFCSLPCTSTNCTSRKCTSPIPYPYPR